MVVLVLGSTRTLLAALESGRTRWWVVDAAWTSPRSTRTTRAFSRSRAAPVGAGVPPGGAPRRPACERRRGVAFLPWLSGLKGDLESTTTDILSRAAAVHVRLCPHEPHALGDRLPYATPISRIRDLPGARRCCWWRTGSSSRRGPCRAGLAAAARGPPPSCSSSCSRVSVPVREAIASAIGSNLLGTRNLAASWPAFALCVAAFLAGAGRRLGAVAACARHRRVRDRRREAARRRLPPARLPRGRRRSSTPPRRRATSSSTGRTSARPGSRRRSTPRRRARTRAST